MTAFVSPVIAVAVALPWALAALGVGTLGHLGLIYLAALILVVRTALA